MLKINEMKCLKDVSLICTVSSVYNYKNFGVGERSIYKTSRTGEYRLCRDAEKALLDLLNREWFKLRIEPEAVDRNGAGDKNGLCL